MEIKFKNAERLSHAYIISAADMADALSCAQRIASAAVCMQGHDIPCGVCRACRKARENIHPDITLVERLKDDKGNEKKEINVDQVRGMSADAYILPNEAERKVYIIKDADTMNVQAQNAALKLLEEPPHGVIFLLCVRNSELLLVTVRSRCVEINCGGEAAPADEDIAKRAGEYLRTAAGGDRAKLFKWCTSNEDMSVRDAVSFCECVTDHCADILCGRKKDIGLSPAELVHISELMSTCCSYLKVNVSVKHIFGLLAVDTVRTGSRGKSN